MESALQANYTSSVSDALYIHEMETENILHSGREWYQPVSYSKETEINPGFKDIITTEKVRYTIRVLARASSPTHFRLIEKGTLLTEIPVNGINLASTTGTYAQPSQTAGETLPLSSEPSYRVSFGNNGDISARDGLIMWNCMPEWRTVLVARQCIILTQSLLAMVLLLNSH